MKTKVLTAILILGFFALSSSTKGQTQIGADIDGEAAGDNSGFTVSMPDENTIAIGARLNDGDMGLGEDVGQVRIFEWNGTSWLQKGADIDGEATGDQSGYSVSMPDVNTVAIGTPYNEGNGTEAGHVRIFEWNGTSWLQKGADIDGDAGDHLGQSVSMPDANTVVIGATQPGDLFDGGYARIYQWNGTAWTQKGTDILSEAPYDLFGISVSMPNANTVAIGASSNDGNGENAGHVRIYEWNGSDWAQKGTDIDGETQFNWSGSSVSMPDANTVAIGAPNNNGQGIVNCGHVRVYHWNGVAWVQKGEDIDGEASQDLSGSSVSMPDENTVAIGAYENDGNGTNAGHVRVYDWNGTVWEQKELDIDGEAANDQSGYSVSMPNSNTIAIGARLNDGNSLNNSGHVRVYSFVNTFNVEEVKHNFNKDFLMFPNPTNGQLNIEFGSAQSNVQVIVRNPLGQQILNKNYASTGSLTLTIEGDAGIYIVEIKGNDRSAVLKVIKE